MNRINTDLSTYKAAALERDSQYIYNMGAEELLFEAVNKYLVESDAEDDIDDEINSSITLALSANEDREVQIMQIVNATDSITFDEMVGCDDIKDVDNEILFELASHEELESMGFDLTLEASRTFSALNSGSDAKRKYKSCMSAARKYINNKDYKNAANQLKNAKSAIDEAIKDIENAKGDRISVEIIDSIVGIILNEIIYYFNTTLSIFTAFGVTYIVMGLGKIELPKTAPGKADAYKMIGYSNARIAASAVSSTVALLQRVYKIAKDISGIINAYRRMKSKGNLSISMFNTYSNRVISDLNGLKSRLDMMDGILMKMESEKIKAEKEIKNAVTESENIDEFDKPIILNY